MHPMKTCPLQEVDLAFLARGIVSKNWGVQDRDILA
jgi:hypothetical protein